MGERGGGEREKKARNPTIISDNKISDMRSAIRGETMLRGDTCFVVLKVSDARKGAEPGAPRGCGLRADQRASPRSACEVEVKDATFPGR